MNDFRPFDRGEQFLFHDHRLQWHGPYPVPFHHQFTLKEREDVMKRKLFSGLTVAFLVLPIGAAFSSEWTSKTPANQRIGPKFGDYLRIKGSSAPNNPGQQPQQGKKGAQSKPKD